MEVFYDGFDLYGIAGEVLSSSSSLSTAGTNFLAEWTSLTQGHVVSLVTGLLGSGCALLLRATGSQAPLVTKTLPGNYTTINYGVRFNSGLVARGGVIFGDSGTIQASIVVNTLGQIEVWRGNYASGGDLLATTTQTVTSSSTHWLSGQITFHNTAGAASIYLDGTITSVNVSGQNIRVSTNNSFNQIEFSQSIGSFPSIAFDDLVLTDTTGAANNTVPLDATIETKFATGDSSVHFAFGAAVLGAPYTGAANYSVNPVTTLFDTPGANELILRKFTTGPAGTLQDVRWLPNTTSATAKNKSVLYADNGSGTAPTAAPIAVGTEVIGTTAGTILVLPFSPGQALTPNTPYWLGSFGDTAINMWLSDNNALGYKVANTYGSGAPTSPSMTSGQNSWTLYGNLTGVSNNWWEVAQNVPVGDLSYVSDGTAGDEDLFTTAGLSTTPVTIFSVKVRALMKKSDAGSRTVSLRIKSGATDNGGSNTGQALGASYAWLSSYFSNDPNTGVAWLPAAFPVGIGYKIDS